MFETERPVAYEKVYEELLDRLCGVDWAQRGRELDAEWDADGIRVPLMGRLFRISEEGVEALDGKEAPFTFRIVLCYYVLHGGGGPLAGEWVSYRNFQDSAFFMASFRRQVEERIARHFSGRLESLHRAGLTLRGEPHSGPLTGDLCMRFPALPKVPLLLVFYDGDEELPPSATVLYDASAPRFLDMECLAVLGWVLADELIAADLQEGGS